MQVTGYGLRVPSLVLLGSGSGSGFSGIATCLLVEHSIFFNINQVASRDCSEKRDLHSGLPFAVPHGMAGWKDFREIAAWQHSQRVKLRVYELLKHPKIRCDVKLSTQLRESSRTQPNPTRKMEPKTRNQKVVVPAFNHLDSPSGSASDARICACF
jgi:hypothetical protein